MILQRAKCKSKHDTTSCPTYPNNGSVVQHPHKYILDCSKYAVSRPIILRYYHMSGKHMVGCRKHAFLDGYGKRILT